MAPWVAHVWASEGKSQERATIEAARMPLEHVAVIDILQRDTTSAMWSRWRN